MKLRATLPRLIANVIKYLDRKKDHPLALRISNVLKSGKVNVYPLAQLKDEHVKLLCDEKLYNKSQYKAKKHVIDSLMGGFCAKNVIYIKHSLSSINFRRTLVHECVHYLSRDNDRVEALDEELAARLIEDEIEGVFFTRNRIKIHIERMKDSGEYFEDDPDFEATDNKMARNILSKLIKKFRD